MPAVLHMELGLVNNVIDHLETWIHALFDPMASVELEVARLTRIDGLRTLGETKDALQAFYNDCRLLSLLSRVEDLNESLDDDEQEELLQLQEEEGNLQEAVKDAKKAMAKAKAKETALAKTFGRLTRPTVLRIEDECFHAWSIRRPSYHGGGGLCWPSLSFDNATSRLDYWNGLRLASRNSGS